MVRHISHSVVPLYDKPDADEWRASTRSSSLQKPGHMRLQIVIFFLLSCSSFVFAQIPPTPPRPGTSKMTLNVRVKFPDDRPISTSAEVQILSASGLAVTENFTHADGRVEFNDMTPGIYRIRVSGAGIETTLSEVFDIGDYDRTHSEIIHVKPVVSGGAVASGVPTVSSQQLNVPEKARNELDKGMEAFAKGDDTEAAARMEKAINIFPRYAQAYNNLGVIRVKQNDRASAQVAFEKSVEIDDHFVPGYVNLARLLVSAREADASNLLQKALAIDPNNLEALSLLARFQFNKGRFAEALATVNRVHSIPHEHFADVNLIAAEIYQKANRNAEAIVESELYLQEYPDSPRAPQVREAVAQIKSRQ
jgi:Tfp pilus assembly protein PilF